MIDHISYSQLSMYSRCGEQYRRRYIEGEKIPPGIALIRGISIHKGAEENNKYKLATKKDKKKSDIIEVVSATFDDKLKDGIWLTKEDKSRKSQIIGESKDDTVKLAGLYCDETAPQIMPDKIELWFEIPLETTKLTGRIDIIDDKGFVRDLKTASKSKNQRVIDLTSQLTCYALAYEFLFGKPPSNIVLDVLVNTKVPKYQFLETKRSHKDIDILLKRLNTMLMGIEKGVFMPADPGESWMCDEKWCGYFWTCPYRNP